MSTAVIAVIISLCTFIFGLLAALVTSTWKFSSLTTQLLAAVKVAEEKDKDLEEKTAQVELIPMLRKELDEVKAALADVTRAMHQGQMQLALADERYRQLAQTIGSMKALAAQRPRRPSRPDDD